MRIWYALPVFPVRSETFVTTEIRALLELGHEVSVHTWAPAPLDAADLLRERGLEGISVNHGGVGAHLRALLSCLRHPRAALSTLGAAMSFSRGRPLELLRTLPWIPRSVQLWSRAASSGPLASRPEVVHLFWGHFPSLLGHLIAERAPDVVLTTSLGAYDLVADYGGSRVVGRRAAFVRTFAAANIPVLVDRGVEEERIALEVHGIDLSRLPEPMPRRAPGRFVSVGRLIPDKGMDDVIRAFALSVEAGLEEVELRIVGDGPDRPRLEQLADDLGVRDRVHFMGHLGQGDVFRELAEAEVLLFLSRHAAERLPNVVKEAMASGCVCITTPTPGIEELLVDGATGRIVRTPEEAARVATELLSGDPEVMDGIREAASAHVRAHFDIRAIVRRLSERWGAAVASRQSGSGGPSRTPVGECG